MPKKAKTSKLIHNSDVNFVTGDRTLFHYSPCCAYTTIQRRRKLMKFLMQNSTAATAAILFEQLESYSIHTHSSPITIESNARLETPFYETL